MGPPSAWDDRIALVREQGMLALTNNVLERWFTPGFRQSDSEVVRHLGQMLVATDPEGYVGCCFAIRDMDLRSAAATISVPTLVIGGDADPATPMIHSEALAAAIPGARLRLLAAAHLSNTEQPEAYNQAVLHFLAM